MTPLSRLLLTIFVVACLAGCSSNPQRKDSISGTAFKDGGLSERSKNALAIVRAMKGPILADDKNVTTAKTSLELDFSAVVAECKSALESNQRNLDSSNNWALGVSIVGLVAGVGGASLAAKATASKSAVAALSGIAGGSNSLQNQLKQSGRDPVEYVQRSTTIRQGILAKTKDFQVGDFDAQQAAMRDLSAICVAYS
jgi:hypothetical protein